MVLDVSYFSRLMHVFTLLLLNSFNQLFILVIDKNEIPFDFI